MNKSLYTIFLLCLTYSFAQGNNIPTASDIFTSTLKEKNTLVHLVGNDRDVNDVLTYSIVSVSGHGVLTDPLNNAVLSIGSTLSNNGNSVNFVPNKLKLTSYIDKGTTSFTYKVNDGTADSTTKTVEIKVYEDFLANPSQVGLEVIGENDGDNLGFSVALSEKGDIMALGSPKFGAATKGRVKVLKHNSVTNLWDDFGNSIEGLVDGDRFGDSVSLSSDGTVLAVGASYANNVGRAIGQVRIFNHNPGTSVWDVIGTIEGSDVSSPKSESEQFGNDVRLSSDGKTLVISDIEYNGGFGRVVTYRYGGGTSWNKIGASTPIVGANGDKAGWSVGLSSNGNILAVGYMYKDTAAGSDAGQVKIFEYDGPSDKWNNKGILTPTGQIAGERFGASLDLSSDGLIIAVGSTNDKPNSKSGEGSASVFKWVSGTTWNQMGPELKDEVQDGNKATLNYFGGYVSLNNAGNILGVLAPGYQLDGAQQKRGLLRLYSYDIGSASWVKIKGNNFKITGEANGDYSANSNDESKGQKVFLSGDGSFVALSAELNDSNGTDSGHVRVFELFDSQEVPVASSDEKTVLEKKEIDITLSATDPDSGPSALKYFITELESNNGQLFIDGNWIDKNSLPIELNGNSVKYRSISETNISDNFKFIVHDGKASSAPVNIKMNITLVNDPPAAADDISTVNEDSGLTPINVVGNDTDPENNALTLINPITYTGTGTVAINVDNKSVNYTPADDFNGKETITYTVSDGENSDTGTLTVTVSELNDLPLAVNDVYAVVKNSGSNSIDVIANDTDVDGDPLKLLSSLTYTGTGTATANADEKSVDYSPATDFIGTEVITYTVSDGTDTDTGTLTITVADVVNNPPVTVADILTVIEDSGLTTTDVLANDSDPEGIALTLVDVQFDSGTGTGSIGINADNKSVDYTPKKDFNGVEVIRYMASDGPNSQSGTLTVTVTAVNDPPVVVNDVLSLYNTSSIITIDVLGNDSDPEDQNLTLTQVTKDQSGTVSINSDNKSVDYTPSGIVFPYDEVITYTVSDGAALNNTATGTLTITVLNNSVPVSNPQTLEVEPNKDKSIVLNGNDADGDPLKYIIVDTPSNSGVLKDPNNNNAVLNNGSTISNNGNTVTFNSNSAVNANTTFSFKVNSCAVANPNNTSSLSLTDKSSGNEVKAQRAYPMTTPPQSIEGNAGAPNDIYTMDVDVKLDLQPGNVFESCEIKLNVEMFDDGLQFDINGKKLLSFLEYHYNKGRPQAPDTQEFNGSGKFVTNGCGKWEPWNSSCNGNPSLEIISDPQKKGFYKVQLMVDTVGGGREDALPYMDKTTPGEIKDNWVQESSFTYDCLGGFNLVIGNQNGGAGNGGIKADLTLEAYVGPCDDSNVATVTTATPNDPPIAKDQSLVIPVDTPTTITLDATDSENDPLTYVVNSLPASGVLKEGPNAIVAADLPRVLTGNTLTYESTSGGDFSFDFIVQQNSLATFAKNNSMQFITQGGVPITYDKPQGKTYFLIQENPTNMDWPEAKTLTDSFEGASMYIIIDKVMEDAVFDGLKSMNRLDGPFWLGLFQDTTAADWSESLEPAGGWVWTDGVKLGSAQRPYTNWDPNEPNEAGPEDFAQFHFSGDSGWNDMQVGNGQSFALFEFSVNSADDSNTATVSIKVEVTLPVADPQTLFFNEGSINNPITLTGSDPKSQPLTYIITSKPDKGTLKVGGVALGALPATVNPNDLTYTPENLDYYGDQKFNFKVNNGKDDSLSATVNIIIRNINDAPESDPGNYTTEEELPVEIIHVGRDKDVLDIFTIHSQMGSDIPQPAGNNLGESSAISSDGKRLILGGYSTGAFARVYNWNGTDWEQLGADLNGDIDSDWFGEYVSITSDGNRIAVAGSRNGTNGNEAGHVKVFDWDGTSWNLVGSAILGDKANDRFGFRGVHLSGDGNSIAIPSFAGGYIYVYDWNGKAWKKRADSFTINPDPQIGGRVNQWPGQVYLSMDGNRIAIGSIFGGANGQVTVYEWDGSNNWTTYSQWDGTNGNLGNTVELTRDGNHIAFGEKDTSSVSVYDISGINPVKIGADITVDTQTDFWRYISLSDDGKRLGIPNLSKNKVSIFDWDGTTWNQLGEDISGINTWGESFDMSSDGTIFTSSGHALPNRVFNILNLKYIVTTLPVNGTLTEGAKTISAGDLPYTLTTSDQKLTYTPNNNFSGTDSYTFKLNDGNEDSTDKLSGLREDSTVTITINDFVLALPNNYTITTTETCAGSNFGIIDVEVKETTYQKNKPSGRVIPLNYNVKITGPNGFDQTRTITSPSKKLDTPLENLEKGSYELTFTVPLATNPVGGGESPPYTFKQTVVVIETVAPIAHPVPDIEVCDDNVDGDDTNGKANFVIDTPTLITSLLTDPNTGVVQDVNLFDFEFEYLDDTTSKKEKTAILPNPLYSANQTILVTMTSKANGKCVTNQSINLVVNKLPVFDRIEDTKSVCTNLPPVTIGVATTDSRVIHLQLDKKWYCISSQYSWN